MPLSDQQLSELKARREREERQEHITGLVEELSQALNVMGREKEVADDFLQAITHQHRTLQQNIMGVMFSTVTGYADASHDGRNEASVNACKRINKLLEGQEIYLPCI